MLEIFSSVLDGGWAMKASDAVYTYVRLQPGHVRKRTESLSRSILYSSVQAPITSSMLSNVASTDASPSTAIVKSFLQFLQAICTLNLSLGMVCLLDPHNTIEGMKWASEAKRKAPALLRVSCHPLDASGRSPGVKSELSLFTSLAEVEYRTNLALLSREPIPRGRLELPTSTIANDVLYPTELPGHHKLYGCPGIAQDRFKDIRVVSVVEPEYELIQIGLEVFRGHSVIYADDCSFEQAPEALNAHSVDVAVDERPGMTHSSVGIASSGLPVALEFIGAEEFSVGADNSIEYFSEGNSLHVGNYAGNHLSSAFLDAEGDPFARCATASLAASTATANIGLIGLYDTSELVFEPIPWPQGLAYLHRHSPGGFVGDSKGSLKLLGRDSLLGVDDQPDRYIPLLKRSSASMEDGARGDGELVGAAFAAPDSTGGNPVGVCSTATRAQYTFRPSLGAKEVFALALGGEPFLQVDDVHASLLYKEYSTNQSVCQGDKAFVFCT